MNRTMFAAAWLLISASAAAGQEIAAPPPAPAKDEPVQGRFVIEFKIVQGRALLDERSIPRSAMIAGFGASSPNGEEGADATEGADSSANVEAPEPRESQQGPDDLWNLDQDCSDATALAAPALNTVENIPTLCWVHNKKSFSYLSPAGENLFRAHKTPPYDLGVKVECTLKTIPGEPDAVELSPLSVSQTTLEGREPVAGLELDAGKPIIAKRSIETAAKCAFGATHCLPITTIPGRQVLLLIRVNRVSK